MIAGIEMRKSVCKFVLCFTAEDQAQKKGREKKSNSLVPI